jgi:hypothetical protein
MPFGLHPTLKVALESLDINFEQELVQFRRLRSSPGLTVPASPMATESEVSIETVEGASPSPSIDVPVPVSSVFDPVSEAGPPLYPDPLVSDLPGVDGEALDHLVQIFDQAEPHPLPDGSDLLAADRLDPSTEQLAELPEPSTSEPADRPELAAVSTGVLDELEDSVQATSEIELPARAVSFELEPPDPGWNENMDVPENYLASSEALLNSLGTPSIPVQADSPVPKESTTLPIFVGAFLVLFMFMIGGAWLYLIQVPGGKVPETQKTNRLRAPDPPKQLQLSPNLAAQEFQDLSTVSLGTLQTEAEQSKSQSSSLRLGSQALGSASSELSLPPPPPLNSVGGAATSFNTLLTPTNRPKSASKSVDRYYVLIADASQETLQKVQELVPEAFVESYPTGVKIQLGVFGDQARAQQFVQEVKNWGLAAEIYHP